MPKEPCFGGLLESQQTVAIGIAAPLKYLSITVKVVALEKVSFSDRQIPTALVNTLTVNDKRYLLNRDNLRQPIQMLLSEKKRIFYPFFFCIFEIYIKF